MSQHISQNPLPHVWCDFNAVGWSGEADDPCYYVFDHHALDRTPLSEGLRVFLFDDDNEAQTKLVGCEATFEFYHGTWRARPDETPWCIGPRV